MSFFCESSYKSSAPWSDHSAHPSPRPADETQHSARPGHTACAGPAPAARAQSVVIVTSAELYTSDHRAYAHEHTVRQTDIISNIAIQGKGNKERKQTSSFLFLVLITTQHKEINCGAQIKSDNARKAHQHIKAISFLTFPQALGQQVVKTPVNH